MSVDLPALEAPLTRMIEPEGTTDPIYPRAGTRDFGSTMIEENVALLSTCGFAASTREAIDPRKGQGVGSCNKFILKSEEFERLITDAGYTPRRRNTRFELI